MDKKYKAIAIYVTLAPKTEYDSDRIEKRYVIADTESGEIVDDAQGYGYKTAQKAYAAWSYKSRDKSKDKEKAEKERIIAKWMKENKGFVRLLDNVEIRLISLSQVDIYYSSIIVGVIYGVNLMSAPVLTFYDCIEALFPNTLVIVLL